MVAARCDCGSRVCDVVGIAAARHLRISDSDWQKLLVGADGRSPAYLRCGGVSLQLELDARAIVYLSRNCRITCNARCPLLPKILVLLSLSSSSNDCAYELFARSECSRNSSAGLSIKPG